MNVVSMIHRRLSASCPEVHQSRLNALMTGVEGLLNGQTLSVTAVGRHSPRETTSKHAIKQADRLIGNAHLFAERELFYGFFAGELLGSQVRPMIVIDWSDLPDNRRFVLLRASLPMKGRSLTLYEEVFPIKLLGNRRVQRDFLWRLKSLLPRECRPIVVTDAGFLVPWFKAVRELDWDFVGRIRGSLLVREHDAKTWCKLTECVQPRKRGRRNGRFEISRSNPFAGELYSVKKPPKGRHQLTRAGTRARSEHSRKYKHRANQPWFLFSSLKCRVAAKRIIAIYATRMQIEESFRDLKSTRSGFAMTQVRCRTAERASNLLLLALIATWILWLIGSRSERNNEHKHYQANTAKRRTLSIIYLGRLVYAKHCRLVTNVEILSTTATLHQAIAELADGL